ncbi:hypothetical protein H4J51_00075 [Colwellia sp. MB02u-18]|uniref:hypothetical protein n=1 Tax=unclassified Colwellia TaxID=196834 RepID=UPI0015F48232|nr:MULTISPECIES: hypothetical protein [unclassified Colwellia]MBA6265833.1 hypothetical protein [Colwellia sp. MB3u-43]MBA6319588.1 hypothetical protein [Colwellia sp. MB02u-19]MBA6322978.1 hypothetical protein [Colwellia sp. MB02u-18]MBA6329586.1 hypothetical protein [Colwellia sp. MB02u-12]MBA6343308.1 hypothetical protein [Colwellia sp. MB02u-1]
MNQNFVRFPFRVLTLGLSAFCAYGVFLFASVTVEQITSDVIPFTWFSFIVSLPVIFFMLIGIIAFGYTTVSGYMPNKLFKLLFGQSIANNTP